jgi:hypothetical protein
MLSVVGPQYSSFTVAGDRSVHETLLGPYFDALIDCFLEIGPESSLDDVKRHGNICVSRKLHWLGALERYVLKSERNPREWVRIYAHLLSDSNSLLKTANSSGARIGLLDAGNVPILVSRGVIKKTNQLTIVTQSNNLKMEADILPYEESYTTRDGAKDGGMNILRAKIGAKLDEIETRELGLYIDYDSSDPKIWRDEVLASACATLLKHVPAAYQWVHQVIGTIVLVDHEEDVERSGSWKDLPGLVFLSMQPDDVAVADVLVHEASHQYFHWMERVGSMVVKNTEELFYSEPVGRERPLDRILIAHHAFSNVIDLFTLLRQNGFDDKKYEFRLGRYRSFVDGLGRTLLDNFRHLSPMGKGMFKAPLLQER